MLQPRPTVVMSSFFTTADTNNLRILVDNHKTVYRRNALISRAPHIGTHTVLKVKRCVDEYEYLDPVHLPAVDEHQQNARKDLEEIAIVADWKFTQTGCDHMVSCNPFYPKSKRCRGMSSSVVMVVGDEKPPRPVADEDQQQESTFSFQTLNGQVFDACQPMCYDEAISANNVVGLASRYSFGKCHLYDPMMMAFYLDPTRRYVNPDTQILERQSLVVRDLLIEPYGEAVVLANIPKDYCDQYARSFRPDGKLQGLDMNKCEENPLVWSTSWLFGESLPTLAVVAYDKTLPYLTSGHDWAREEEIRHPPTRPFLESRDRWLNNRVAGKKRLPFPLRLSDIGIISGTDTEWLVWTDEFSHLEDGRNDSFGGRLVERDRPVPAGLREKRRDAKRRVKRDEPLETTGGAVGNESSTTTTTATTDDGMDTKLEAALLKSLGGGAAEYQRILDEDKTHSHIGLLGLSGGLAYGIGYEYMSRKMGLPSSFSVLRSAFRAVRNAPSYARKIAPKVVGFWAAKAVTSHAVESLATRSLVSRLKTLAFAQTLGPLAVLIDLVALTGMAVDITFVLLNAFGVSTPTSRRQNSVSDRRLYRLAQTEVEFNHRLYGTGSLELTPSQFLVNTPYLTPQEDIESYMSVMPIVYTARELNSNGGRLKPDAVYDGVFEVGADGSVHYVRNGVHHGPFSDTDPVSSETNRLVGSIKMPGHVFSGHNSSTTPTQSSGPVVQYWFVVVLFIAATLVGYFYPMTDWKLAVALLISVVTVSSLLL